MLLSWTAPLFGGMESFLEEISAHVFHIDVEGEWRPVIGVNSVDRVSVLLEDGRTRSVKPDSIKYEKKSLPPVGRITRLDTQGSSFWSVFRRLGSDKVWFEFEVVADRPLEDVYVVLFVFMEGSEDIKIGFSPIDDLPAGEVVTRRAYFPHTRPAPEVRWQFKYSFYVGDLPVEIFEIESVYNRPETQSLQIPWEARLKTYLEVYGKHNLTRPMQPFFIRMEAFSPAEAKAAGIAGIRPRIRVAPDGTVEIVELDTDLSDARRVALLKDVASWRIFPPVKEGQALEKTVICPIQF
jgi:hypothetical protein